LSATELTSLGAGAPLGAAPGPENRGTANADGARCGRAAGGKLTGSLLADSDIDGIHFKSDLLAVSGAIGIGRSMSRSCIALEANSQIDTKPRCH
jgi:hypothetical protein